jgi:hypothetical protein
VVSSYEKLKVDEIHTASHREHKYTLLHLEKRARITEVDRFMHFLKKNHNIIKNELYGYDQISSNQGADSIIDHPGMKLILQAFKEDSPRLESWTNLTGSRINCMLSRLSSSRQYLLQPGLVETGQCSSSTGKSTSPQWEESDREPRTISFIDVQASKKHPLLVEQLFNPELLAEVEKWDMIEQKLKEDQNEDEFEQACQGTVYFASTPTLPEVLKIGGTKFDGATRVRQLFTAGVPERYVCQFEFKCNDWKLFEGVVHEILKSSRLYKRKEFFAIQHAAAAKLIDQVNGTVPRTNNEQMSWNEAVHKVTVRLQSSRAKWAKKQAILPRESNQKN